MKKILKMLVLGLLSAALLCCALPSAFAAEDKDSLVPLGRRGAEAPSAAEHQALS